MYAPGIVGVAVGLLILLIMKDSPESIGYPPIEPKKTHAGKPPFVLADISNSTCPLSVPALHIYAANVYQTHNVQ